MKAAITILNQGYNYADEIDKLAQMGIAASYIPLEGTDDGSIIVDTLRGFDIVPRDPNDGAKRYLRLCGGT